MADKALAAEHIETVLRRSVINFDDADKNFTGEPMPDLDLFITPCELRAEAARASQEINDENPQGMKAEQALALVGARLRMRLVDHQLIDTNN